MASKIVLCEGKDDKAVIEALLNHLGLELQVAVESIDSRDKLGPFLLALSRRADFVQKKVGSLGVILDADNDPNANWQRIVGHVRNTFHVELIAPSSKVGDKPAVAGLVIPAAGASGMLETVCLEAVNGAPEFGCFERYVHCVESVAKRQLHPKAKFRAWMASQPDFDFMVEKAAKGSLLPWEHNAFDSIRAFLCLL